MSDMRKLINLVEDSNGGLRVFFGMDESPDIDEIEALLSEQGYNAADSFEHEVEVEVSGASVKDALAQIAGITRLLQSSGVTMPSEYAATVASGKTVAHDAFNIGIYLDRSMLDSIKQCFMSVQLPMVIANFSDTGNMDYLSETVEELEIEIYNTVSNYFPIDIDGTEAEYGNIGDGSGTIIRSDDPGVIAALLPKVMDTMAKPLTPTVAAKALYESPTRYLLPIMQSLLDGSYDPKPDLMKIYNDDQNVRNDVGHPKAKTPRRADWDLNTYQKWDNIPDEEPPVAEELARIRQLAGR